MLKQISQYRGMTHDIKAMLGKRIRELRESRGLTQEQLAKLALKSVETISNFERGKTVPSVMTLAELASQLNAELKDFFDFTAKPDEGQLDQFSSAIELKTKLLSNKDRQLVIEFVELLTRRQ